MVTLWISWGFSMVTKMKLLLLFVATVHCGTLLPLDTKYSVTYSLNANRTEIEFSVEVETRGWVGLG